MLYAHAGIYNFTNYFYPHLQVISLQDYFVHTRRPITIFVFTMQLKYTLSYSTTCMLWGIHNIW